MLQTISSFLLDIAVCDARVWTLEVATSEGTRTFNNFTSDLWHAMDHIGYAPKSLCPLFFKFY